MILVIFSTLALLYAGIVFWQKRTFRFLSFLISPIIILSIKKRISKNLEDKNRYTERYGIPSIARPSGNLIWIHAVSVGETISIIPFIEEFKKVNKDATILLTTTTLTAYNIINERLNGKVIHQFMPFDVFRWIRRFVKYWKPNAVFFVESELWPNMLYYLNEQDIPIYLLNARFSEGALKRMYTAKKIFNILPYKLFTSVFVPSEKAKIHVRELGARDIKIIPNLKIIAEKLPVDAEKSKQLSTMLNSRKTWMAVSTHKGEEEIIVDVHQKLKEIFPDILTVIAIRHPSRAEEIKSICESNGLSVATHTEKFENGTTISEDIYILNKIGELGEFFENIDTVLVGGSLIPGIGGHNFLEPIKFMCNVASGQYIGNFRDIYDYVSNYCKIVENKNELLEFIEKSIKSYKRDSAMLNDIDYTTNWINAISQISKNIFKKRT